MTNFTEVLESLVTNFAESQNVIVTKLRNEKSTEKSAVLLEKAGNNLKEIIVAYEKLSDEHDLLTAEQVLEMNFFPGGTMSVDKLYRLARQSKIPAIRFDGRVFFSRKVLREFVCDQCMRNVPSLIEKREQKERQKALTRYDSHITAIPE